jgi:hypothetical protein
MPRISLELNRTLSTIIRTGKNRLHIIRSNEREIFRTETQPAADAMAGCVGRIGKGRWYRGADVSRYRNVGDPAQKMVWHLEHWEPGFDSRWKHWCLSILCIWGTRSPCQEISRTYARFVISELVLSGKGQRDFIQRIRKEWETRKRSIGEGQEVVQSKLDEHKWREMATEIWTHGRFAWSERVPCQMETDWPAETPPT